MASTMFMRVDEVGKLGLPLWDYPVHKGTVLYECGVEKDGLYYHFRPDRPQILPRKILWHKRPERKE